MDPYAASLVSPDLDANERLLWAGRPDPLALALARSWLAAMASAMFLSAGSLGLSFSGATSGPISFALMSTFQLLWPGLLIIGLSLALVPVLRFYQAQGTMYAITDERAIILSHFPYRAVSSITANRIAFVRRRERDDNTSDVLFAEHINRAGEAGVLIRREGFYGIPDGQHVDRLIRGTFLDQSVRGASPGVAHGPWATSQRDISRG